MDGLLSHDLPIHAPSLQFFKMSDTDRSTTRRLDPRLIGCINAPRLYDINLTDAARIADIFSLPFSLSRLTLLSSQ